MHNTLDKTVYTTVLKSKLKNCFLQLRFQTEYQGQELLVRYSDPAISVSIIRFKGAC